MIRNNLFVLNTIEDSHILMPTGQAICMHPNPLSINELGVYIWTILENDLSIDEVLKKCANHDDITDDELLEYQKSIIAFISALTQNHMILDGISNDSNYMKSTVSTNLNIGGIKLCIHSFDDVLSNELLSFKCDCNVADYNTLIISGKPAVFAVGDVILRNEDMIILENDSCYSIAFNNYPSIFEVLIDKESLNITYYVDSTDISFLKAEIYETLRTPFLLLALNNEKLMLHSASVLANDKLILFSASAGTGKSTQADIWQTNGHTIINGDLNLIGFDNDKILCYPTPWCGTSKIFTTNTYELGAVAFIKRADESCFTPVDVPKAVAMLLARCINPMWNESYLHSNTKIAKKIAKQLCDCESIGIYSCTKNNDSYDVLKNTLKL